MAYIRIGPVARVCLDYKSKCIRVETFEAPLPGYLAKWSEKKVFYSDKEWSESEYSQVEMDDDVFIAIMYFWVDIQQSPEPTAAQKGET